MSFHGSSAKASTSRTGLQIEEGDFGEELNKEKTMELEIVYTISDQADT